MAGIKSLAKDTAIYGLSSIIGRFLNWCLVPLYTQMFPSSEYGIVSYIYAIVALALIILTYGMETGFFRFANHERYKDPMEVYSTSLISLGLSSTAFLALVLIFIKPISTAMHSSLHESYIVMMAIAVALRCFHGSSILISAIQETADALRISPAREHRPQHWPQPVLYPYLPLAVETGSRLDSMVLMTLTSE